MARDGLLIGVVATSSGVSRKALRLHEARGIVAGATHRVGRSRSIRPMSSQSSRSSARLVDSA